MTISVASHKLKPLPPLDSWPLGRTRVKSMCLSPPWVFATPSTCSPPSDVLNHFLVVPALVVSKQEDIAVIFETRPLQRVGINGRFNSIPVVQKITQGETEGQLRQMFEVLPGIVHRLSRQQLKAKVKAPYLSKRADPHVPPLLSLHEATSSTPIPHCPCIGSHLFHSRSRCFRTLVSKINLWSIYLEESFRRNTSHNSAHRTGITHFISGDREP